MGIRELWLVDTTNQEIEVRSLAARSSAVFKVGQILRSRVLNKIRIPVAAVFS